MTVDERRGERRGDRTGGLQSDDGSEERLVRAALQVSRAQLLLTGTLDYLPDALRELAEESLEDLGEAVQDIRSVVVAGRVPAPRTPHRRHG